MRSLVTLLFLLAFTTRSGVDALDRFVDVNIPQYNCTANNCLGSEGCHCASHITPGGLRPEDTPQFIVITNDDAITVTTMPVIVNIVDKYANRNGCPVPATWYISVNYTDPALVQEVYMKGHEIATHTMNHVTLPGIDEIVGAKLWLNQTARVPLEKIKGFRAPFLVHNLEQRAMLQQNGFTFDSSIPEVYPTPTSPAANQKLWPYSMNFGLPQSCHLGTGPCSLNETLPGLWEFPMWAIQDDTNKVITTMDPPGDLFEAYKREFNRSYTGNRAPLGVYVHAAWLMDPTRADALTNFIRYAIQFENVFFATVSDVISWIKNPVSAEEYAKTRPVSCMKPTDMWFPSGSFCKKVQCVNGNWTEASCDCTCAAEFLSNQPGFCADAKTGACTLPKIFNPNTVAFECPAGSIKRSYSGVAPAAATTTTYVPLPTTPTIPTTTTSPTFATSTLSPTNSTITIPTNVTIVSPAPTPPTPPPQCGHQLMSYVALSMSGSLDGASKYIEATKAVDSMCTTCAMADSTSGNYFMVTLKESTQLREVYVVVGEDIPEAYIFVGESSEMYGMKNPVCANKISLSGGKASKVKCELKGKYVTIATRGMLPLCDMYAVPASAPMENAPTIITNVAAATTTTTKPEGESLVGTTGGSNFQSSSGGGGFTSGGAYIQNGADMALSGDFNKATQALIDKAMQLTGW